MPDFFATIMGKKDSEVFDFLRGKRIIQVGFLSRESLPEGYDECNFAIDYEDGIEERRVILGYNDLGLWKAWDGEVGVASESDILREKLSDVWDRLCDDTYIKGDPLTLRYCFFNDSEGEIISLSIRDFKLMSNDLGSVGVDIFRHFKGIQSSSDINVDELVSDIGTWIFN